MEMLRCRGRCGGTVIVQVAKVSFGDAANWIGNTVIRSSSSSSAGGGGGGSGGANGGQHVDTVTRHTFFASDLCTKSSIN
jgi:hypothetical protein